MIEPDIQEKEVQVHGRTVHYRVAGEGEPVVLVHGLAGSLRWWESTVPALAQSYKVYLVDLPGFGKMRNYPGGFKLSEASSWLGSWLNTLGLQRAHLIGHSMGAYICLLAAVHNPRAVCQLVLIDPAGVPSGRTLMEHIWPLMQECVLSSPALLPTLVRDSLLAGPFTIWRAANDLLAQDVRADLHRVCVPTLLVWGENDTLVPPSLGYILKEEIAGSHLVTIKGSRHVPMLDQPRVLNKVLLQFLAGGVGNSPHTERG